MKRRRILTALLLALLLLPTWTQAAGRIEVDAGAALTLTCRDGSTALEGAWFDIYRVAALDEYGALHATEEFAPYAPLISGKNSEDDWRVLAETLESYVRRDEIPFTDSGTTDRAGRLTFPTGSEALAVGLYLVIGERLEQDGNYYDPAPFLILLPTEESGENGWVYDVSAAPKFTQTPIPEEGESLRRKVIKVWDDAGYEALRPESVTVQLLRDGRVYDTVELNERNSWRYEWIDLDAEHRWSVAEIIPDGYFVTISREGITFVVRNYRDEGEDADIPGGTDSPEWPTPPESGSTDDRPTLPQTGQLWWPVPALLITGTVLVVLGLLHRREE